MSAVGIGISFYPALKELNMITKQHNFNDKAYRSDSKLAQAQWITQAKKAAAVLAAVCLGAVVVNCSGANLLFTVFIISLKLLLKGI